MTKIRMKTELRNKLMNKIRNDNENENKQESEAFLQAREGVEKTHKTESAVESGGEDREESGDSANTI